MNIRCQCKDTRCPCKGHCQHMAVCRMFRTDQEDDMGIALCDLCGDDAFQTGLYMLDEIGILGGIPVNPIH